MKILVLLALTSVTLGAPPTGPEIIYADLNHPPSRETNNLPRAPDSQYASINEISPQGTNNNPQVSGSEYASIDDLGLHGSDAIYAQPLTGENALRAITALGGPVKKLPLDPSTRVQVTNDADTPISESDRASVISESEPLYTEILRLEEAIDKITEAGEIPNEFHIYGEKVTLQELLGFRGLRGITPEDARRKYNLLWTLRDYVVRDVVDRDPSLTNLEAKCDGIEYVDRNFLLSSAGEEAAGGVTMLEGDTPTLMANKMLMTINKFVVIQGDKGSGKTVTLTKMLNVLRENSPKTWSLIVDINTIPVELRNKILPSEIITYKLSQVHADILLKVIEANPTKVNIFVDNVDKLPAARRVEFLSHLEAISQKGTGVAVTSTQSLGWKVGQTETRTVVEIPGLNSVEIEQYLTRHSDKKLGLKTSEKHADYAKAVAKALEGDAIPKDLRTMRELKALLIDGDRDVFSGEKKFVSVREYAAGETSNPREVLKMLEEVKINKLRLMEKLTASSVPADLAREYGIRALESVLSPESRQSPSHFEIEQLRASHQSSSTKHPMDFIKSDSWGEEVFVHPEYERYFAAQYLTEKLRTVPSSVLETAKIVLQNPKYAGMAEYLNAAMEHAPESFTSVFQSITLQDTSIYATLDNAIAHGFDEIASAVLKTKNSATTVWKYFETAQKASPMKMESKFRNKLGMMTTGDVIVADNKQEMVFRKNMDKTVRTLNNIKLERKAKPKIIWHLDELPKYLEEIVLAQSQPNMETYEIVKEYIPPEKFTPEFANRLVQTAINHECMDIRIYSDLIKLGATPSTINVNGETLVHTAVKNRNSKLLKFVINELKVAVPVTSDSKLLFTALDTNPLNRYSASEFWKTMEILIEHGIAVPKSINVKNYEPTAAEKALPIYKLFIGEADPASPAVTDLRLSSTPLNEISPGLKSYRRNAVLSNIIGYLKLNTPTLTEILLAYRGLDALSLSEQAAYERCILGALKNDATRGLSFLQKSRIAHALIENVATSTDIAYTMKFIVDDFVAQTLHRQLPLMKSLLKLRINTDKWPSKSKIKNPLQAEALLTRTQEYPEVLYIKAPLPSTIKTKLIPIVNTPEFADIFKASKELSKPLAHPERTLITDDDYSKIVEMVEKNGKSVYKINTDNFCNLLDALGEEEKENQLLELGKELASADGAMLDGTRTSAFLDRLDIPEIAERLHTVQGDRESMFLPESTDVQSGSRLSQSYNDLRHGPDPFYENFPVRYPTGEIFNPRFPGRSQNSRPPSIFDDVMTRSHSYQDFRVQPLDEHFLRESPIYANADVLRESVPHIEVPAPAAIEAPIRPKWRLFNLPKFGGRG